MKTDAHIEKMKRKAAERASRASKIDGGQVKRFVGYYKGCRARNGVGSPKNRIPQTEQQVTNENQ